MKQIHIRQKQRRRKGTILPFIIGSILFHLLLLIFFIIYQFDFVNTQAKKEKKQPDYIEITEIPVPKEKETKPPKETKRLAERSHEAPEEKTRDEFTKRAAPPPMPPPVAQPQPKPETKKQAPKPAEKKAEKKAETKVAKRTEPKKAVKSQEQLREEALAALPKEELKQETGQKEAPQEKGAERDLSQITREDLFRNVPNTFPQESQSTPDYLGARDVNKKEDTVELSTTEYKYFSYFAKLKRQIEGVWGYPEESRYKGEEGQLFLVFTIKRNGELENIELLRSSGYARLDNEAIRAIRNAAPYAPFPEGWGALERLHIKATFIYQFGGFIR